MEARSLGRVGRKQEQAPREEASTGSAHLGAVRGQASVEPRKAFGSDDLAGCVEGAVIVFVFGGVLGVLF